MPFDGNVSTLTLPRAICDFETYSEKDVRKIGAWAYAEHPSTEILCLSYRMPGWPKAKLWWPDQPFPQELREHVEKGYPVEAHNCQFERAVWHFLLFKKHDIPNPKRWIDTIASCAYRGLPQDLDKVGTVLDLPIKKDRRGKYLLNKLSKPQKPTKKNPETRCTDFVLMEELGGYCCTDSDAEYHLGETIGDLPINEYNTWVMDQRINLRGVYVDMHLVHMALKIVADVSTKLEKELGQITGGKFVEGDDEFEEPEEFSEFEEEDDESEGLASGQVKELKEWCQRNGATGLPNLKAPTIEDFLKFDWLPKNVKRVLEIRQTLSKASTKKLIKFATCTSRDQRIRGLLQYHGAGTGRWAGRLVQPQNFPRGDEKLIKAMKKAGLTYEHLVQCIKEGNAELLELHYGDPMVAIAYSLRGMFIASPGKKLYVADFASIEARVLMWLAEEEAAIQAFYDQDAGTGADIYLVMAMDIYGYPCNKKDHPKERQLGKTVILGCGYQMSGPKLASQSAIDLVRAGMEPLTEERGNELVDKYRKKFPKVPALWKGLENAAIDCVEYGRPTQYGRIRFEIVNDNAGKWLTMILPNGRRLWYFRPDLEEKEIAYFDKKTGERKTFTKSSLKYEGRSNKKGGSWTTVYTYGGMLTENAVQAIARDLMVAAMYRAEKAGFPVILTVHDELVAERDDDGKTDTYKIFEKIVAGPNPKWAEGCPVAAEGWEGYRYRK